MNRTHSHHWLPTLLLGMLAAWGCRFEQDPAKTVTVEISGISDEARDAVQETLKGMTDVSGHTMTTRWDGQSMTVNLSPVADVEAFSKKVNFGKVTAVEGRTVKVDYVE